MKTNTILFILGLALVPFASHGATKCSRANLTRCLDSACAINISSNPAARCQYCGTDGAGTPPTDNGIRSVSVGQSAKFSFTAKELKSAPTDPGQRYAWASKECLAKVAGCTPDDIEETYDSLIEQSCKAAGISAEMSSLQAAARKTKSQSSCKTDVQACVIANNRCTADFSNCHENADFDKFFAACSVDATGCDSYISAIRTELIAMRDNAVKSADTLLATVIASYQSNREKRLTSVQAMCTDNAGRDQCIQTICERSMRYKCDVTATDTKTYDSEMSMATQLCKYYDIACATLK